MNEYPINSRKFAPQISNKVRNGKYKHYHICGKKPIEGEVQTTLHFKFSHIILWRKKTNVHVVCHHTCHSFAGILFKNASELSFHDAREALDAQKVFLSRMKSDKDLSMEHLADKISKWRTLEDSVSACLMRDTIKRHIRFRWKNFPMSMTPSVTSLCA